jgi:hypothetical protein
MTRPKIAKNKKFHLTTEEHDMIRVRESVAFALIASALMLVDKPQDLRAAGMQTDVGISSAAGGTVATWQEAPTILAQYNPCPRGRCGK